MNFFSRVSVTNLLLIIGIVTLTICGVIAHQQVRQIGIANDWTIRSHQVIGTTNGILLAMTNAEAGLAYSAVTGNKSIIENIPRYLRLAQERMALLLRLTKDNPIQFSRAKDLAVIVNELTKIIQQSAAQNKIIIYQGMREINKKFTQDITEFNQAEISLLEQRNTVQLRQMSLSNAVVILFSVLSVLFIILSLILINYSLRQRNIAEQKRVAAEKETQIINRNLQASEERYILATEGSAAGLWDWEVGTDHVYYSPYFRKMLGYTENDFPNSLQSFEKIIHPQDHNRLWQVVDDHLKKHAPFKAEYRLRHQSGAYSWYQAAGQAIWNDAGNAVRMSGSIIDIDDRKKAELSLRIQHHIAEALSSASNLEEVSKEVLKKIGECLKWEFCALWRTDYEHKTLNCIQTWYQSARTQVFAEKTRQTVLNYGAVLPGKVWQERQPVWFTDIVHDERFLRANIAASIELKSAFGFPVIVDNQVEGVIECYATEHEVPDKHILDLMKTVGAQLGLFASRKIAERNLRESEAYKTSIFKSVSDSIITLDIKNNIIFCNEQIRKEFGYEENELYHKNIITILPNIIVDETTINKATIETNGLHKNGQFFPVEIKISSMTLNNQIMSVVVVRNVTERRKVEKMKNEFVSVVSHELRTPLTSIRGAIGLVAGGALGVLPEKTQNLLNIASNNCDRLLLLINDILDIEKLEAGKMQFNFKEIDINQFVSDAIEANKIFAKKYQVELSLTTLVPGAMVKVDPDRLMQVLTNLISNAIKFSPTNEEVTLEIQQRDNKVRIAVANKGPGIPLEVQPLIFQKFIQADTSTTRGKGGTGLGLSISKSIAEKLSGSLTFTSKPDEVTIFYLDLPLWQTSQSIIKEQKEKAIKDKILICEDDEEQANYLATLLKSAGFQVDTALNAATTKKLLKENTYHALLLDLILPDQDGISLIRELRMSENTRTLPIIVISTIAQTGRAILNGDAFAVLDWLDKPIHFDKVLHAIKEIHDMTYPDVPSILHVEDDPTTSKFIKTLVEPYAKVVSAFDIHEAITQINNHKFNLIILDLLLPDGNAQTLLPLIAQHKFPVIVYSAQELDVNLAKSVQHILLKSKTSNEKLLDVIKHVLKIND